jgi:hypothetical protein
MPSFATIVSRAITVALLALAPAGVPAVQAQPTGVVIAQAGDDEEEPDAVAPRRRGEVTDEAEGQEEAREENPLPRQGASRRLDPFDYEDAPSRSKPAVAAANPGSNVVVCEAGCDGPRGTVVYRK